MCTKTYNFICLIFPSSNSCPIFTYMLCSQHSLSLSLSLIKSIQCSPYVNECGGTHKGMRVLEVVISSQNNDSSFQGTICCWYLPSWEGLRYYPMYARILSGLILLWSQEGHQSCYEFMRIIVVLCSEDKILSSPLTLTRFLHTLSQCSLSLGGDKVNTDVPLRAEHLVFFSQYSDQLCISVLNAAHSSFSVKGLGNSQSL